MITNYNASHDWRLSTELDGYFRRAGSREYGLARSSATALIAVQLRREIVQVQLQRRPALAGASAAGVQLGYVQLLEARCFE